MESVMVEIWASVMEVPPIRVGVVEVKKPADLLMLDKRGQADDKFAESLDAWKPAPGPTGCPRPPGWA